MALVHLNNMMLELSCPQLFSNSVSILGFFLITTSLYYHYTVPNNVFWNQNFVVGQKTSSSNLLTSNVSYPWTGDPTCNHFTVQFAVNKSRPAWALASFPGSGVTWLRQLIEGVTGIYTGTVYGAEEPTIIDGNYYGNYAKPDCGCTILIKDHRYPEPSSYAEGGIYQHRGILLLRNPFDALFTFAHYLWSGSDQKGTVPIDFFSGREWDRHIDYVAFEWAEHADRWIQNIQNGTVIFYECLLNDTEGELKRLINAINFIDPRHTSFNPERMRCALLHKDRLDRKRMHKPMILLNQKDHSKIMSSIERVQKSLRKKGWQMLPMHLYHIPNFIDS